MIRARSRALAILAVSIGAGCLQTAFDDKTAAIVGGIEAPKDTATVALVVDSVAFCSGVLISERVILSAGHCVGVPDFEVLFGASLAAGGEMAAVAEARAHQDFQYFLLENDLAVIILKDPAPVEAAALPTGGDELTIGAPLRLVGFGTTGPGTESGVRRAGEATVDELAPDRIHFRPSPALTCHGDSGGPIFATVGASEVVVGITSSGDSACSARASAMRIAAYLDDFVIPFLEAAEGRERVDAERCYVDENCASGRCLRPDDSPRVGYCTSPCTNNSECETGWCETSTATCRLPLPSPGAELTDCERDADCSTELCYEDGSGQGYCANRCSARFNPCSEGLVCDKDSRTCLAPSPGGCSSAPTRPSAAMLLILALAICVRRRRASRPRALATGVCASWFRGGAFSCRSRLK